MRYDLNTFVKTYNIDSLYEQYKRLEFLDKLGRYVNFKSSKILEFGSATGQMTKILSNMAKEVVAIDGSSEFINIAKNNVGNADNIRFYESYFEDFDIDEQFDCIILHHVLEHINDPIFLLLRISKFLKENGVVGISVPNANAMSRQLAVKMGLLSSLYDLTENDICHGHTRIYNWNILLNNIEKSGYTIIGNHGLSMKLFSDKQNMQMINANIIGEDQIKGLWLLADEFREIAGAIMSVAIMELK